MGTMFSEGARDVSTLSDFRVNGYIFDRPTISLASVLCFSVPVLKIEFCG